MKKHSAAIFILLLASMLSSVVLAERILPVPLVEQRADPSVLKVNNHYYMVATAPEYDRIELRHADKLVELGRAQPNIIWRKHSNGPMGSNIWAPEIIKWDGVWYIYFAAGDAEDPWRIRMYVLANKSADPSQGVWEELGQVKTARDSFSLDETSFEHKGQRYFLWAQRDAEESVNSAIYIAKQLNPTSIGTIETKITSPNFDWETQGYKVNEGPAVLIHGGKIFISYSASATDHRYAMGLLWADENANLLDAKSWHKSPLPVFYTNEKFLRYGPGHNSFVIGDDNKTTVMVYHARDYKELQGTPLTDPNRHTYMRSVLWKNGFPGFGQDSPNDIPLNKK